MMYLYVHLYMYLYMQTYWIQQAAEAAALGFQNNVDGLDVRQHVVHEASLMNPSAYDVCARSADVRHLPYTCEEVSVADVRQHDTTAPMGDASPVPRQSQTNSELRARKSEMAPDGPPSPSGCPSRVWSRGAVR